MGNSKKRNLGETQHMDMEHVGFLSMGKSFFVDEAKTDGTWSGDVCEESWIFLLS